MAQRFFCGPWQRRCRDWKPVAASVVGPRMSLVLQSFLPYPNSCLGTRLNAIIGYSEILQEDAAEKGDKAPMPSRRVAIKSKWGSFHCITAELTSFLPTGSLRLLREKPRAICALGDGEF